MQNEVQKQLNVEGAAETDFNRDNIQQVVSSSNKKIGKTIAKGIIIAFFGFSTVTLVAQLTSGIGSGYSSYSEAAVIATAKHYVRNQLKSPSSAKFCPQNEISIYEASDGIIVSGYVDADNSFGAKIRNYFTVTLTSDGQYLKNVSIR